MLFGCFHGFRVCLFDGLCGLAFLECFVVFFGEFPECFTLWWGSWCLLAFLAVRAFFCVEFTAVVAKTTRKTHFAVKTLTHTDAFFRTHCLARMNCWREGALPPSTSPCANAPLCRLQYRPSGIGKELHCPPFPLFQVRALQRS